MDLICTRGAKEEYRDPATKKDFVSVSQVLSVLDPDAFAGVDPFVLASAQQRGTDLHVLFALTLFAEAGLADRPARPTGIIRGYYAGIEAFIRERSPRPIRVEESSIHDKMGYAGTPDTECWLGETDALIDLKTGPPRPVHAVQLHAYKRLKGYENVRRLYSLYIKKDGTYKLIEHTHDHIDWAGFLAAITVLHWRRQRG